jgi:hypothetical protein
MAWIRMPGIDGLVFVPEQSAANKRKRRCKDCFSCQHCGDTRCNECVMRKQCRKKCGKQKTS